MKTWLGIWGLSVLVGCGHHGQTAPSTMPAVRQPGVASPEQPAGQRAKDAWRNAQHAGPTESQPKGQTCDRSSASASASKCAQEPSTQEGLGNDLPNTSLIFFDSAQTLDQMSDTFQLIGDQGYDVTLGASDLEPQGEHGARLTFKDLSESEHYTLYQYVGGVAKMMVFKDASYEQVTRQRAPTPPIPRTPESEAVDEEWIDVIPADQIDPDWNERSYE